MLFTEPWASSKVQDKAKPPAPASIAATPSTPTFGGRFGYGGDGYEVYGGSSGGFGTGDLGQSQSQTLIQSEGGDTICDGYGDVFDTVVIDDSLPLVPLPPPASETPLFGTCSSDRKRKRKEQDEGLEHGDGNGSSSSNAAAVRVWPMKFKGLRRNREE
jgi:hypothetical protein